MCVSASSTHLIRLAVILLLVRVDLLTYHELVQRNTAQAIGADKGA